jgi:HPt (histidine-containing phosphotransfer) domain-containing protein
MTMADGEDRFAQELVQLFIDSGDATLRDIRDAISRGDIAAVGRAAHSYKGSSANIRAESASTAASRLEEAARAGAIDQLAGLEAVLRREAERAKEYLKFRRTN